MCCQLLMTDEFDWSSCLLSATIIKGLLGACGVPNPPSMPALCVCLQLWFAASVMNTLTFSDVLMLEACVHNIFCCITLAWQVTHFSADLSDW